MNRLIYGLQYGDEGKGRVSAYFSNEHEWSVRFNGGPNAGHTVWHNEKQYKLNHFPAGSVMGKKVALDAGMVIDLYKLYKEYQTLDFKPELYVSNNAHIITDSHLEEDAEGSGVGSTKRGIAYAYRDKVLRQGLRVKEEIKRSSSMLHLMNATTYDGLPPIQSNESAIYESAQGIMLDVDYGCYPYVTSSSVFPTVVHDISEKIGVLKAYTSRVGDGPPNYPDIPELRELGQEYGTTTGRPRRCTWLIMDEVEYALKVSKPNTIVVTKLDILKDLENIKVWSNGKEITIGNLNTYKEFLLDNIPNIKYFSESADGDLIKL